MRPKFIQNWNRMPRDIHRTVIGGAWLFALGSLIPLLWLAESYGNGGVARVFGHNSNGVDHGVWGLTYSGIAGGLLLWLQIIAVIAANIFTLLRSNRLRRIGHGAIIAWAAWWMMGAMYLATIDPLFWTVQSVFQTVLLGCVAYRAARSWNNPPQWPKWMRWRGSTAAASGGVEASLTRDEVIGSARVKEIYFSQGNRSRSTLPPESTIPTRLRLSNFLKSLERATATGTAALGSMTTFIRSKTRRIASMMRSSGIVKTRST
jgi:hypothetical protein